MAVLTPSRAHVADGARVRLRSSPSPVFLPWHARAWRRSVGMDVCGHPTIVHGGFTSGGWAGGWVAEGRAWAVQGGLPGACTFPDRTLRLLLRCL